MAHTQTQEQRNRVNAKKAIALRLEGDAFAQFQSWRSVADKMGIKKSDLTAIRQTDEFVAGVLAITQDNCKVYAEVGLKVRYKKVRDWMRAAFGIKFARSHGKYIWQQCQM